jgi:hypothetical protein
MDTVKLWCDGAPSLLENWVGGVSSKLTINN